MSPDITIETSPKHVASTGHRSHEIQPRHTFPIKSKTATQQPQLASMRCVKSRGHKTVEWQNIKTLSMAGGLDSSLALSKRIKKSHENTKLMLTCAKTDPFHLHCTFCPCCHSRVLLANCVKIFFDFHSKRTADLESHRSSCTPEVRQDCTKHHFESIKTVKNGHPRLRASKKLNMLFKVKIENG